MSEKEKITDDQLLDILENNDNKTQEQIADILGISQPAVSKRIRNLMERGLISDKVQERVNRNAFKYIKNLEEQSDKGDTAASVKLLEIGKIYIPASKHKLEGDDKKPVIWQILNHSSCFPNYNKNKEENPQSEVTT